jgi:probable F420-dependent oxidoreductase
MDIDVYSFGAPLGRVEAMARKVESLGFSGLWFSEAKHNPYLCCALASVATTELMIGTDIAVAFPRSPMVTAQAAWDLADASNGRFVLGLGTQVKGHIERRFSATFDRPVARLRDYVLALRAIWQAFQGQARLAYQGEFYAFSLLTEFFDPGPIAHPDIPVYVAGVNRSIAVMAGEVCDGFHVHPFHSVEYLRDTIVPAIAEGATKAARHPSAVCVACPVFVIVGDDEAELEEQRRSVRRQLAFYGSTRTYRGVFAKHGWDDASAKLHRLMAAGDLDAMEQVVTDEMLDTYSVTSSWDDLAPALLRRYDGLADRVFPYSRDAGWMDRPEQCERWRAVAQALAGAVAPATH